MVKVFGQIFITRNEKMGDMDFARNQPVRKWISKAYARSQAQAILKGKETIPSVVQKKTTGQTTHLSIMDSSGNAIAMTLTQNLSFGSCVTTILQVIYRNFALGQKLSLAMAAPRVHYQASPNKIFVEQNLGEKSEAKLKKLNKPLKFSGAWGNVQAVSYQPATGRYSAESDPRGIGKSQVVYP